MAKRALLRSLSDVDIRLIRVFITVTECGGFAASELELNIGRSTISKHISDLELRIGLKLCNRGPSGFSLTLEGQQVLDAAHELLAAIDGFKAHIDNIHIHLTGTLRLGLFDQSTTNPHAHVHEAIRSFDTTAPDVAFEIALAPPSVLEARVTDGTLDIAIVPIHRQSSALQYTPLYEEHMTLYCGEGHPLFEVDTTMRAEDLNLAQYKYAGYGFNSPNMMAGQNLGIRRAARVQEEEALSLLIQSGRYLGYLADHVAETFLRKGAVRAVAPEDTGYTTRFAAIVRKKPASDRKTEEFLRCLVEAHDGRWSDVM
ncbi:LysR family transcriptional regulator [uncultured Roseobacter sp.]|uniref:LysR family transcriptional regulator n=1 Tax=uncultured Roseobacter sp. TaxID=114847 RepID=UPI002622C8AC|nr:LysR family transcriptional regulator [uncultured Roseobacter sp.]